jgi:hypothetical protein
MTDEQKAAAAAKRKAKKADSDNESFKSCSEMPGEWAELLSDKKDLSFYPVTYDGQNLLMNDRGDVVDPEEGVWVGRLVAGVLNKTVAEPSDIAEVVMRE